MTRSTSSCAAHFRSFRKNLIRVPWYRAVYPAFVLHYNHRGTMYSCPCVRQRDTSREKTAEQRAIEDDVIAIASAIMRERMPRGNIFTTPGVVKDFLAMNLACREHEVFACMYLTSQHQFIDFEVLFRGSLTQTSVYPREVVKQALAVNAAAVIFAHNHPSGVAEPSRSDDFLTRTLTSALQLVDVKVIDHFVIGAGGSAVSFAERGLL